MAITTAAPSSIAPSSISYDDCVAQARGALAEVDGWLSDREMQFLVTLAAYPTCAGEILELGAYHGKSTIALALGTRLSDNATVHTIDPISGGPLQENLHRAGVAEDVVHYHAPSTDETPQWSKPLRLLWHDGANDLATVDDDLRQLTPWLVDGAIVAFHDVLNTSGMRIFVFTDAVLDNPHFGVAGVCGSIGWAQYRTDPSATSEHRLAKRRLARKLRRLEPFHHPTRNDRRSKLLYKFLRANVPHGPMPPATWLPKVA